MCLLPSADTPPAISRLRQVRRARLGCRKLRARVVLLCSKVQNIEKVNVLYLDVFDQNLSEKSIA
jgi:hypothetical protein